VREHAGDAESAWDGVGQGEGLCIWRIEDFKVARWPDERKGQFYDGDSYIVLHVSKASVWKQKMLNFIGRSSDVQERSGYRSTVSRPTFLAWVANKSG
jgi:hypothetical protein